MQVEMVRITDLKLHPKNPRVHPDSALEKLERSIREFGWTNPILVSTDGYILAGHARLKTAERMGLQEIPVIYLPLEGAKANAYMVADNRLQDDTDWDLELLVESLRDLAECDFDLFLTGFSEQEIDDLIGVVPDFEPVPIDEQPRLDEKKKVACPNCGCEFTP
jgi:ParB-like chromosome segregation protein Spo0J